MLNLVINALLVAAAVWLNSQIWHISGMGLVASTTAVYVAVRLVFGFVFMLLTGRRNVSITTWL